MSVCDASGEDVVEGNEEFDKFKVSYVFLFFAGQGYES